jgi:hypothetical protein
MVQLLMVVVVVDEWLNGLFSNEEMLPMVNVNLILRTLLFVYVCIDPLDDHDDAPPVNSSKRGGGGSGGGSGGGRPAQQKGNSEYNFDFENLFYFFMYLLII